MNSYIIGIVLDIEIKLAIRYERLVTSTAGESIKLRNNLCFSDTNARKSLT